jgi:hypothetical protein
MWKISDPRSLDESLWNQIDNLVSNYLFSSQVPVVQYFSHLNGH